MAVSKRGVITQKEKGSDKTNLLRNIRNIGFEPMTSWSQTKRSTKLN